MSKITSPTHNLLHNLARRVKVDETLVNLELVAVPRLGTLTARLDERFGLRNWRQMYTKK